MRSPQSTKQVVFRFNRDIGGVDGADDLPVVIVFVEHSAAAGGDLCHIASRVVGEFGPMVGKSDRRSKPGYQDAVGC